MFEDLNLTIGDDKAEAKPEYITYTIYCYQTSRRMCSETSPRYCC